MLGEGDYNGFAQLLDKPLKKMHNLNQKFELLALSNQFSE